MLTVVFALPPLFEIPVMAPVNAVNEKILAVEFPSWLLLILMATPVAPALDIPVNGPEEITENPCIVLLLMLTLVVAVPPELKIPVIAPDDAMVNISAPPVAFPNWFVLIFIAVAAAPVFEMPVNAPAAAVLVWLLIILEFILTVVAAAEFEIPDKIPVPV